VRRAFGKRGESFHVCREGRWENDLGRYYTVDLSSNCVASKHLGLEETARDLGVLKPDEVLADEE
jgi:hypothetical protein